MDERVTKRVSSGALIAAFAFLWIPLGQQDFLVQHWMKVGTFMAPFLVLVALSFSDSGRFIDTRSIALALLVAYILHQFEEHWVDVYGRTFAFKPYLNAFLSNLLGHAQVQELMSDESVFVINTSLVWLVGALAVWRGGEHIFAAFCMAAIVVVNAISHIGAGLISGSYNPGLLTAILIFLPVGVGAYVLLARNPASTAALISASLIWGLTAHLIMIGGILAMSQISQLPESVYFAVLIAWSVLPACIFPNKAHDPIVR
ncbi:MAG: HXXEE domain-containing protein [Pseudomonadota bacterium]